MTEGRRGTTCLLLLRDFKERYPYYRGACAVCGSETEFVGEIKASQSEETCGQGRTSGTKELRLRPRDEIRES